MDRFLSKAKETFSGQWRIGFYVYTHSGVHVLYDGYIDEFDNEHFEIDTSTLCQCTGLKDKNGKLIFEGDIVACIYKYQEHEDDEWLKKRIVGDIKTLKGLTSWYINDKYSVPDANECDDYEVIGNIHDKKEVE